MTQTLRACARCGRPYDGPKEKRFCSSRCRQEAWWARYMGKDVAEAPRAVKRPVEANGQRILGFVVQDPKTGQMRTVKVDG